MALIALFRIPHSAFRILHSALAFCILHSEF